MVPIELGKALSHFLVWHSSLLQKFDNMSRQTQKLKRQLKTTSHDLKNEDYSKNEKDPKEKDNL